MVAATTGRDAQRIAATSTRHGAKKGGIDYERGERPAPPPPAKVKRPPTEAERYIASLVRVNGAKYLNADVPRDHRTGQPVGPLDSAICGVAGKCGHAYAHLMVERREVCRECMGEEWEAHKAAFARELGDDDDAGPSIYRVRELAHRAGKIGGPSPRV